MGDVELDGIEATCLAPASRIIGMPGIIGICDGPAKPGDLSFGDVTSFESKNKKRKICLLRQPFKKSLSLAINIAINTIMKK